MVKGFTSNKRVFSTYSKGWELTLAQFLPLIAVVLILAVIQIPSNSLNNEVGLGLFSTLWSIFLIGPVGMSASWVFLKAARKEKFKLLDMFSVFQINYWNAVLSGVLVILFILIGLVFLIVPGLIIATRMAFVSYLIVDKKMEALQAIRESWKLTKGHAWRIFGMYLLAIPLILAGLLALVVGVFFVLAWIESTFAVLYNSIDIKKK